MGIQTKAGGLWGPAHGTGISLFDISSNLGAACQRSEHDLVSGPHDAKRCEEMRASCAAIVRLMKSCAGRSGDDPASGEGMNE